jgi:hypothetical protein
MHRPISDVTERQLLEAVCRGDEDAFRRLVEPHRPGLRAHCDRILGTLDDGEDAGSPESLARVRALIESPTLYPFLFVGGQNGVDATETSSPTTRRRRRARRFRTLSARWKPPEARSRTSLIARPRNGRTQAKSLDEKEA